MNAFHDADLPGLGYASDALISRARRLLEAALQDLDGIEEMQVFLNGLGPGLRETMEELLEVGVVELSPDSQSYLPTRIQLLRSKGAQISYTNKNYKFEGLAS